MWADSIGSYFMFSVDGILHLILESLWWNICDIFIKHCLQLASYHDIWIYQSQIIWCFNLTQRNSMTAYYCFEFRVDLLTYYHMERHHMFWNLVNTASGNGLAPYRCQSITWARDELMDCKEYEEAKLIQNLKIFSQEINNFQKWWNELIKR